MVYLANVILLYNRSMIARDQPQLFDRRIVTAVSSKTDGTMRGDDQHARDHRRLFLRSVGIDPAHTVLVGITYNTDNFARYTQVARSDDGRGITAPDDTIIADALVTTEPGVALFLPLADCAGLIVYDPVKRAVMVAHMGRHSTEIDGVTKSLAYMGRVAGVRTADVRVWVSPAVGRETYPLFRREGRSLHEEIRRQLLGAGVPEQSIELCGVDTAKSGDYFSHSEFLAGRRDDEGRFAVVAMLR